MLNPVVMPLPLALAVAAALAYAAVTYRSWVQRTAAWTPTTTPAPAGRHRLDRATAPYRPRSWVAVAAEHTGELHPPEPVLPGIDQTPLNRELLTEVERSAALALSEATDELLAVA